MKNEVFLCANEKQDGILLSRYAFQISAFFYPLIFAMTTVCAIYVYNITFRTLYLLPRSSDALLPCQYVLILRDSDGALQERKTVM